jgi:hypothetical protein
VDWVIYFDESTDPNIFRQMVLMEGMNEHITLGTSC